MGSLGTLRQCPWISVGGVPFSTHCTSLCCGPALRWALLLSPKQTSEALAFTVYPAVKSDNGQEHVMSGSG